MKKLRSGFTLIEVSLFLAVTGVLFFGVTVGVQNSIAQQRYNDSVQSFAEFLRNVYSEVTNVQHNGEGDSGRAVYGKMITFGETCNLSGKNVNGGACNLNSVLTGNGNTIFEYNIVGDASDAEKIGTGDTLELLVKLKAGVVEKNGGNYALAGIAESYEPKWQAQIEPAAGGGPFTGTVLVVRNPGSGTVSTFYSSRVIHVNQKKQNAVNINWSGLDFKTQNINFCVNQDAEVTGNFRRDVRIQRGARNASGVIVETDDISREVCG